MGKLLPNSKYLRQTPGSWRVGAQQIEVQHMARLEETRKKEKEPHSIRSWHRPRICMEQITNGRLGSNSKPNFGYHNHTASLEKTGLYSCAWLLLKSFSKIQWTADYVVRTISGVRGALRQPRLAEPPTRLVFVGFSSFNQENILKKLLLHFYYL